MEKGFYDYFCDFTDINGLTGEGLCKSLSRELKKTEAWSWVTPDGLDIFELKKEGKPFLFWGSETLGQSYELTERRQNILLLAACINGEKF